MCQLSINNPMEVIYFDGNIILDFHLFPLIALLMVGNVSVIY